MMSIGAVQKKLVLGLTVVCLVLGLGFSGLAQESVAKPGDYFWQEVLFGTGGAYLGSFAGGIVGFLVGGCARAQESTSQALNCAIGLIVGAVVGQAIGATAGIAITAGFHNIEGNLWLAPLGAVVGTIGGTFLAAPIPSGVSPYITGLVPAFTASTVGALAFNLGARVREPKAALAYLGPTTPFRGRQEFSP